MNIQVPDIGIARTVLRAGGGGTLARRQLSPRAAESGHVSVVTRRPAGE